MTRSGRSPDRAPQRVLSVLCPSWPVVAAGAAERAAIVVRANRVVARSAAAAAVGVRVGQRRREAQRASPDAELIDHDPDRDARAFEPVIAAVGRFTPHLEVIEPGWINLAARGPARYFGGEPALADQLVEAVTTTVGCTVRVGIADGRFAAAVAAHSATRAPRIVPAGTSAEFLAPLPIGWLTHVGDAQADFVDLCTRLGLHRLGDLAALPGPTVADRFGPAGAHAHRLAAGLDPRPTRGAEPAPPRTVEHVFDAPVEHVEPLLFVAKQLADRVTAELADEGLVCTRLVVTAETDHQERTERAWYRANGLTTAAIVDRVRWHLTSWITDGHLTAGVTLLRLVPDETRADRGEQPGLWGGRQANDDNATRAIARVATMLGEDAVTVPRWHGGLLPDDRYQWIPAAGVDLNDPDDTTERLRPALHDRDGRTGPWPGALPGPAPLAVHHAPPPVELTDHADRPVQVTGRGELTAVPATVRIDGGRPRRVVGWAGPWPAHQRWWEPTRHHRRARLQVILDDGTAHLVVAEHQRWWLTATYC